MARRGPYAGHDLAPAREVRREPNREQSEADRTLRCSARLERSNRIERWCRASLAEHLIHDDGPSANPSFALQLCEHERGYVPAGDLSHTTD